MSVPIDEWRMNKKISNRQKLVLDSLVCERLSSDERNLRLVDGFCNYKNPALADVILNEAFEEDEGGSIAYYIIKHKASNKVLFYFSLKSGMLLLQSDSSYKFRENTFQRSGLPDLIPCT